MKVEPMSHRTSKSVLSKSLLKVAELNDWRSRVLKTVRDLYSEENLEAISFKRKKKEQTDIDCGQWKGSSRNISKSYMVKYICLVSLSYATCALN